VTALARSSFPLPDPARATNTQVTAICAPINSGSGTGWLDHQRGDRRQLPHGRDVEDVEDHDADQQARAAAVDPPAGDAVRELDREVQERPIEEPSPETRSDGRRQQQNVRLVLGDVEDDVREDRQSRGQGEVAAGRAVRSAAATTTASKRAEVTECE
jgi:hypothetical protein